MGKPSPGFDVERRDRQLRLPQYPREIEFVPDLPKTISGKIRRVELRKLEEKRKLGK